MAGKAGGYRGLESALADFIELLGKAILSGIAASVFFGLVALGLASAARAQALPGEAKTGTLLYRAGAGDFAPAPKVDTEVTIHVTGIVARTRVAQTFLNPGTDFVEGLYVFPLPENAAIDRLLLAVGTRLIEGQVQEKAAARRAYAQAKREGRKASLLEQQRPNLFTNAVAHIGPGEVVKVTIEYQQALAPVDGVYRLRFPLAVTPRYDPAAGVKVADSGVPASDAAPGPILHPGYEQAGCGAVNPVAIGAVIDFGVPLREVRSSYHDAWVEKESGTRTVVYLQREQEEADRDFELAWSPDPGAAPAAAAFTESVNGTDYALLMVVPPQPSAADKAAQAALPRETVFVIDTSGSMQGASMEQARAALLTGLATLSAADSFNVVEFNSVTRPLWPAALPATAENLRLAREWVGRLRADGGTEMAAALEFALSGAAAPGVLRQVVFMTDGSVSNEEALFRLIAARLGETRLFTVGIGAAPNGHFMTKAAQFGRGTFTYIGDLREVQARMSALFAKIGAPVLKDVAIRWPDGTPVETYPPRVPDLYLGEPIVVTAAHAALKGTILVTGTRGNQPWSVALTPSPSGEPTGVGALWARARIASLMDELRLGADEAVIRPAVLQVALEHRLVSRYTSLVAVDVTPTAPAGETRVALVKASPPSSLLPGELPQTDTESTLQIVLGLLALAAAGAVVLVGRLAPAGGASSPEGAR